MKMLSVTKNLKNLVFFIILFLILPDQAFCKTKTTKTRKAKQKETKIEKLEKREKLENIFSFIAATETEKQIPKGLLKAVIRQESSFDTKAYLGGSYGLGQITLGTAKTYCDDIHSYQSLYEYTTNITCAGEFLKVLLDKYNSKYYALSAYNIGTPFICNGKTYQRNLGRHKIENLSPCSVKEKGRVSNEKYVAGVMGHWKRYKI